MYPFLRLVWQVRAARRQPPLGILDPHRSTHLCWPWDLDPWVELNNGRTLTIYDLGRIPLGERTSLHRALKTQGWGMTVAGNTVRYRKRVQMFDRVEMVSRCIGWDHRFLYVEQSMWKGADCASQQIVRAAVTSPQGIVAPARLVEAMGQSPESPPLPGWISGWVAAEAARPWPPQR